MGDNLNLVLAQINTYIYKVTTERLIRTYFKPILYRYSKNEVTQEVIHLK